MSKRLDVKVGTKLRDRDKRQKGRVVIVMDLGLPGGRVWVQAWDLFTRGEYGRRTLIEPVPRRWEVIP